VAPLRAGSSGRQRAAGGLDRGEGGRPGGRRGGAHLVAGGTGGGGRDRGRGVAALPGPDRPGRGQPAGQRVRPRPAGLPRGDAR
jgi:hypothetical protein